MPSDTEMPSDSEMPSDTEMPSDSKESLTREAAHCRTTKLEPFLILPFGTTYYVVLYPANDVVSCLTAQTRVLV
jgi:hypothetical protein